MGWRRTALGASEALADDNAPVTMMPTSPAVGRIYDCFVCRSLAEDCRKAASQPDVFVDDVGYHGTGTVSDDRCSCGYAAHPSGKHLPRRDPGWVQRLTTIAKSPIRPNGRVMDTLSDFMSRSGRDEGAISKQPPTQLGHNLQGH